MLHFVSFFVQVNASKAVRLSCTFDSCMTVVERPPSSANREIDASANFERPPFGRCSSDSQKQNMLV